MASYKIKDIEGIGEVYAAKLRAAGIRTVSGLLKAGCERNGRKNLAAATGIDESQILKWVNMADLYRVRGIGSEYSELLEKAGVDTVKELRNRNADNLHAKLAEVNAGGRRLVRQLPALGQVRDWVAQALKMEPKVTY
jgi:predicted flap endonuclease-1-like 5' DNA nuclease